MRIAYFLAGLAALAVLSVAALQLGGGTADASENQVPKSLCDPNDGGTGIRKCGPFPVQFANLTLQCPNVDVYVRAGCDGGACIVDAGPGDLFVSFNASNDSYPFPLDVTGGQNQLIWQNVDGGVAACYLFRVQP